MFKNNPLPFHDHAMLAAEAAMAAHAQGKFWPMYEKLFANQQALERADLEGYAKDIGLDLDRFRADLDQHRWKDRIGRDQAEAAEVEATGTPTFFINGKKLSQGNDFDNFKALIDQELKAAEELVSKGTPRDKLYETIIKDGKRTKPLADEVHSFSYASSPVLGPRNAKVKLYVFSDFQ